MNKKATIISVLAVMFLISALVPTFAATAMVSWDSASNTWKSEHINNNTYTAIVTDAVIAKEAFGIRPGALDHMYWSGSEWVTVPINSNTYNVIASDNVHWRDMFGVRAGGGLDQIYWGTGNAWESYQISANTYTALAADCAYQELVFGARAGGLDEISWTAGTGWQAVPINSNTYTSISTDNVHPKDLFGVRPDGRLDQMYASGSTWVTSPPFGSNTYTKVVLDRVRQEDMFCVRADGLDQMYWAGGWQTVPVNATAYTALIADGINSYEMCGARSDGQWEFLRWISGIGWTTQWAGSGNCTALAADGQTGRQYYFSGSGFFFATETPTFDPPGGTLAAPTQVTIACGTAGATIRYTTDGNDPTLETGTVIASGGSILVDRPMTLKAKAWKDGSAESAVATAVFTTNLNRPAAIIYGVAPTIDGNLADWNGSLFAPIDQVYDAEGSIEGLLADIPEAYYAARWSDSKIYVAIKVKDIDHVFTDGYENPNARDSVEIYIHTNGTESRSYSSTQAAAQQYCVGIKNSNNSQVWTVLGWDLPIPAEANFQAAGSLGADGWIYYEAAITPFHHFSLDGTGLIESPLRFGDIIGLDVNVPSCDVYGYCGRRCENTILGKYEDYMAFGRHLLVKSGGISDAKKLADAEGVVGDGAVSALFGDSFYLETTNRASGIRVFTADSGVSIAELATVTGTMQTLPSGERYIFANNVASSSGGDPIRPLGLSNKSVGGSSFGDQTGVAGGSGLNNIGLLVRTTGKIIQKDASAEPSWFVIDDGSGVNLKVIGTAASGTPYVTVTGISSCEKSGVDTVRVILATEITEVAGP